MDNPADVFLNGYVLAYLLIVVGGQIGYAAWRQYKRRRIARRRRLQGLPSDILLDHAERLADRRAESLTESAVLLLTVVVTPFALIANANGCEGNATAEQNGLAIVFVTLLFWVLVSATDVTKAFLGGLAFKTLAAFKPPFQVGDRVTLKGVSGKVIRFDTFFIVLQTSDDRRVSLPTHTLWTEVLTSANAGARASLCVMQFYLPPSVTPQQRQAAEDVIWNAIQASVYFEPSRPMQIYLKQTPEAIQLTAKAYVASTYNEPLFTSDVTRAFLDFATEEKAVSSS
ncbi:MAG: mechanosensitive ion channel [Leptolyngbya sp. SIO4C1]|nr:mechanosensitive ion channel [Leptolyngbya sp. SIO4C1]